MTDQNMTDFYDRVRRYEALRTKGYAHEATGALGRSFYYGAPQKTRRRSVIAPVLFALVAGFLLKAAIFHTVGSVDYSNRVARLEAGEGFDRLGAWLMQEDPVTLYLASKIGQGIGYLK